MLASRSTNLALWVAVMLLVAIAFIQWQQLSGVREVLGAQESIQSEMETLRSSLDAALDGAALRVDITNVSANEGVFDDVEGGFISISPVRLTDDEGNFDQFFRIPVSLIEPVDVDIDDEVDVYVTGGFVEIDR